MEVGEMLMVTVGGVVFTGGVQLCVVTADEEGVPVQPLGVYPLTVRVCVPLVEHVPQAL